jgi:phenylacetaldehyde dehydrogenase
MERSKGEAMAALKLERAGQEFATMPRRMLIGGAWVDASDGATLETVNPATGAYLTHVPAAGAMDVDAAVRAARRAFEQRGWRDLAPAARARLLWRVADLIEGHGEELAAIETLDNGMPLSSARAEIQTTADFFRYWAGWPTKIEGSTSQVSVPGTYHTYTVREPVGVVGAIVPWNLPAAMSAWKIAPALACGNTVILKPAEQTPLLGLRLGELLMEAGVPDGVFNVVTGFGEVAGAAIAEHQGVDKVAFTGSVETGKTILKASAGNLKRVSLELGGKSPNIVFADADLEAAIAGAAFAVFFNAGESCTAGSRLYVEASVFDEVVEGVADAARRIRLGSPLDTETDMGPLISAEHLGKVSGYVEEGLAAGATAQVGGARHENGGGYFYEPTVLVDVQPDMRVVREEVFGPVVVAAPFTDEIDVLRTANDTRFGLAAGVWTSNLSRAHRAAAELRAGTVWINCYHVVDLAVPFGGMKESGVGRDLGPAALDVFTETKAVYAQIG